MTYQRPLASTVKIVDLSDIIASRKEAEGLDVLRTMCDIFKDSYLEEVNLSDNAMGSKGVTACHSVLQGQVTSLERLLLCNNGLSEASMNEVADILCGTSEMDTEGEEEEKRMGSRLTQLHFYNNMSGNGGCQAFARILSTCSETLEDIRFSGTRAGREGSLWISKALEQLGGKIIHLKYLDLADNTFGTEGGSILAKALRRCVSLQRLNLRDCVLEDEATSVICRALWAADAPMEILDLSGNEITKHGAKAIAELLQDTQSTLKIFHCEENEMTSKGVVSIASALGGVLEELRLGFNECGSMGANALVTANGEDGDGMPSLQKIFLDGNMFPEKDVAQLTESFGDKLEEMEDNDDEGDADDELSESEDDEEDEVDELSKAMGKTNITN